MKCLLYKYLTSYFFRIAVIFSMINVPTMGQGFFHVSKRAEISKSQYFESEVKEVRALSQTQLLLVFKSAYNPILASQSSIFTVNDNPPKGVILNENGIEIILELSTPLIPRKPFILRINEDFLSISESLGPYIYEGIFEDGISEIVGTDGESFLLIHNFELESNTIFATDFSITDHETIIVKAVEINENGIHIEFSQNLEEGIEYLLNIPERKGKNGNKYPASTRSVVFYANQNEILLAERLDQDGIRIYFSQPLDKVNALIPDSYTINDKNPRYVEVAEDNLSVVLHGFRSTDQTLSQNYLIKVKGLFDLYGHEYVIEKSLKLKSSNRSNSTDFRSVVINEVMAAPRASNSLPNVEYIELYNTTDQPVDLTGFILHNSRRNTVLPEFIIDPKGYVILSPRNQAVQFQSYGKTLGLTNWPTLLNAGDLVLLTDAAGVPIDSLRFTTATYGGSTIAQGGYSLELVNPYLLCHNSSNIKPSGSQLRGTPGSVNSVYDPTPDRIAPKFDRSEVLNSREAVLYFSKILQPPTSQLKIETSPALIAVKVSLDATNSALILTFDSEIIEGIKYKLQVTNLRDCSGNQFTNQEEAYIVLPGRAEEGNVVLSEVLFNPRTGAPKFIEIYNTSTKYISLRDWKLANFNAEGEIANRRLLFSEQTLLEPHAYLVFTTQSEKLFQEYPKGRPERFVEFSSLPSYPIAAGNVVFLNPDETLVEIFTYSESMHHGLLREPKGVSLERLSYEVEVNDPGNWHSASASLGFATPGYRNSQNFDGNIDFGIEISPKVFVPDGPGESNITKIGYKMTQSGQVGTINIYSVDGQLVRQICQNAIWGEEGFYIWDGTFSNGTKVRPGYYLVWVELFDLNGNVNHIKKTVVVGTKF